jgi:hypothetical protein
MSMSDSWNERAPGMSQSAQRRRVRQLVRTVSNAAAVVVVAVTQERRGPSEQECHR